jgi:PAS domain S-box-containing protein
MGPQTIALKSTPAQALVQLAVGLSYFVLAKAGLLLAIVHPSASAIWPASGLAMASVLLWGRKVWPAVFAGAFLANVGVADIAPSLAIAAGNTAEAVAAAVLLNRWGRGTRAFESTAGVATFAVIALASTAISATVGASSLWLSGEIAGAAPLAVWLTWWLGDFAGAIVVAPAVVLWVRQPPTREEIVSLFPLIVVTILIGVIAFNVAFASSSDRGLFAFTALVPLLWTALRKGPRDTATVSLLLSTVAVWGTLGSGAPHYGPGLNQAFLMTLIFLVSTSLPSLALSTEISVSAKAKEKLRRARDELESTVERRTRQLMEANAELRHTIDQKNELAAANEKQRHQLIDAQRIAKLGSWAWDLETGLVTWSPQLHEIYGVKEGMFAGTVEDFISRLHPDDRDSVAATIKSSLDAGTRFNSHERIIRPDGEIRHLESYGEVIRNSDGEAMQMLGICQDVTSQKTADDALRESEEQIRRLVNGIHDYAIFMLDPSGRIVSWNAGAARIKQYTREEILGKHVSQFYTPEERASNLPGHALKTAAREGRYEGEGWRVRQDGTRFWANVVIDAIYDASGKLIGFGKITRDVTEKREAMLALEQARDQLAQAQKMETIGQVTGGVAHDFNNLLAAIISSLHLLEKRVPSEPQSKRLLENALKAAERGASLTQRLLTFARRQDLKPEVVEVPKLISGMTDLLRRSIGPSVAIDIVASGTRTTATVDPTQLELAIFNLALNARDAMPNGGSLMIDIAEETVGTAPPDTELRPGRYVLISVRDTGIGMDEETRKRAIEPFFTTKGIGKGTGLGLSMVHGLAVQSGGAMRMESAAGRGTTVQIWLPASDQVASVAAPLLAHQKDAARNCRVLVVDDDPLVAMGTVAMLEDLGHSAIEVSSGRQALSVLETEANNIDVVITDQAMPGMTGIELIGKIRAQRPMLPIILATGWAELPDNPVPEFLRLSKPYRQEDLAAAICRVLAETKAEA